MTTISKEDIKQIIKMTHITDFVKVTEWEESKKNEAENLPSIHVLEILVSETSVDLIDTMPMKLTTEQTPVIKVNILKHRVS